MKSKAQVLRDNSEYKTLINAVIRNIGLDSVSDVNNHGMQSGFSGFIYYSETHVFAMRYRKMIVSILEEQADGLGIEIVEMVSGFNVFRSSPLDNDDRKDLYKYLGGGRPDQGAITNIMAWFAAEEVCRMFED